MTSTTFTIPYRLEAFPGMGNGWTSTEFDNATPKGESGRTDAAWFFETYKSAAMPCWRRFDVVDGRLVQAR